MQIRVITDSWRWDLARMEDITHVYKDEFKKPSALRVLILRQIEINES